MELIKEITIEYIENIYALSVNYLKDNNNIELKYLLRELELIEDKIRECNDEDSLNNYRTVLEHLISRIEAVMNE